MVFGRKKSLSKGSTTAASVESFADFVRARARRDGIVLSAPVEKELARAASSSGALTLSLRNRDLTDEHALLIAAALREHPCVDKLDMRDNGIGDAGARALCDVMRWQVGRLGELAGGREALRDAGGACLRRAKLDGNRASVASLRELDAMQPLAARANARLRVRACFVAQVQQSPAGSHPREGEPTLPLSSPSLQSAGAKALGRAMTKDEEREIAAASGQGDVSSTTFEVVMLGLLVRKGQLAPLSSGEEELLQTCRGHATVANGDAVPAAAARAPPTPADLGGAVEREVTPGEATLSEEATLNEPTPIRAAPQPDRSVLVSDESPEGGAQGGTGHEAEMSDSADTRESDEGAPRDARHADVPTPPGREAQLSRPSHVQERLSFQKDSLLSAGELDEGSSCATSADATPTTSGASLLPPPAPAVDADLGDAHFQRLSPGTLAAHARPPLRLLQPSSSPARSFTGSAEDDTDLEANDSIPAPELPRELVVDEHGRLDLSGRALRGLSNIKLHTRLHTLDLSCNQLRALDEDFFSQLDGLQVLDLSHNLLARCSLVSGGGGEQHENSPLNTSGALEFRGLPSSLERLDLSNNRIVRMDGLEGLTRLRVLRLAHNQLRSCSGTEGLVALEELNLSANAIANVLSVRSLACNHALRRLELRDNPLSVSPRCE